MAERKRKYAGGFVTSPIYNLPANVVRCDDFDSLYPKPQCWTELEMKAVMQDRGCNRELLLHCGQLLMFGVQPRVVLVGPDSPVVLSFPVVSTLEISMAGLSLLQKQVIGQYIVFVARDRRFVFVG